MPKNSLAENDLFTELVEVFDHPTVRREGLLDSVTGLIRSGLHMDCCFIRMLDFPDTIPHLAGPEESGCHEAWNKLLADEWALETTFSGQGWPRDFEELRCGNRVAVPILLRGRAAGLLFLGSCTDSISSDRLRISAEGVAGLLALLLRRLRSYEYLQSKSEAMTSLLRVSSRLEECRNLDQCLSGITRAAAELTGSSGAVLRIAEAGSMTVRSLFLQKALCPPPMGTPNDEEAAQRAMASERAMIINDSAGLRTGGPVESNLLALPIEWEGIGRGVITVFDRRSAGGQGPLAYSRQERESLAALAKVGAWAIAQMRDASRVREISRSLRNRIKELALLHHITRAALNTDDAHVVVRSLLSAITHREGLGFDRALLFLFDEDAHLLKGSMGVEVIGWDQRDADKDQSTPTDGGFDYWVRNVHRDLDSRVETIEVEVDDSGGVLAKTVLERKPFHVKLPRDQEMVSVEIIREMGGVTAFATVPLVGGERVLGVIWADNIHTLRPIGQDDFRLLVSAGAQAGLTVEKAMRTRAIERMKGQIMDLQSRLVQWEKLAALGEMAATVAHEIRNPLVSLGGFARRLAKMLTPGSTESKYTDIIMREVARLERTLEDVMDYSKGYVVADMERISLKVLVDECVELVRENFRSKGVRLVQRIEEDLPEILVDQRQVRQAVINILVNSGQAVGDGGEVTIDVCTETVGVDRSVNISITDDGGGVKPGDLDRIFEPFFTTKGTGTGLGLTIAQRAISGHGGEIRVDNRPGVGVTFSVLIPVDRQSMTEERGSVQDRGKA
ncbi:MAG: GAF domain-containing protein [bacterium]|nr:MAG: GAF domain-containing protein [bacterium]